MVGRQSTDVNGYNVHTTGPLIYIFTEQKTVSLTVKTSTGRNWNKDLPLNTVVTKMIPEPPPF